MKKTCFLAIVVTLTAAAQTRSAKPIPRTPMVNPIFPGSGKAAV